MGSTTAVPRMSNPFPINDADLPFFNYCALLRGDLLTTAPGVSVEFRYEGTLVAEFKWEGKPVMSFRYAPVAPEIKMLRQAYPLGPHDDFKSITKWERMRDIVLEALTAVIGREIARLQSIKQRTFYAGHEEYRVISGSEYQVLELQP